MTELINSRRRLEKVTYTPLILPQSQEGGGALETASAVAALGLLPGEAAQATDGAGEQERAALLAIEEFASAPDATARLAASSKLAQTANNVLANAVEAIHRQRENILQDTFNDLVALIHEYQVAQPPAPQRGSGALGLMGDRLSVVEHQLASMLPEAVPAANLRLRSPYFSESVSSAPAQANPMPVVRPPDAVAAHLAPDLVMIAYTAASWMDANRPERARRFTSIPATVIPPNLRDTAVTLLMNGLAFLIAQSAKTTTVKSHLTSRQLQPLGLLHLEDLVMTPMDVERGELIYTLPMAPGEKVTLSHKEWSIQQEEYTRFVQDYFQNYSERGVAEKTDIAVSSKSETEHTKTLSMSRASAPGGATLADPVNTTTVAGDVTTEKQSQEQSRRDTREITERASALSIRDQKVSFTVATVSGTEDFTARLFENKHDDKVMIVDYFRKMRKWHNQLFRTGIRLTYDVVLPDPGRRLRERWRQVKEIDAQLSTEFQFALGSGSGSASKFLTASKIGGWSAASNVFSVPLNTSNDIDSMSAEDIEQMARDYGVTLPPAPNTLTAVDEIKPITGVPVNGSMDFEVTLHISEDYRPTKIWFGGRLAQPMPDPSDPSRKRFQFLRGNYWDHDVLINADEKETYTALNVGDQEFASLTIPVGFIAYDGATGEARVRAALVPTPAAWRKWRSIAYAQIRQGAITRWNDHREILRQKRAALLKELEAPDALSLRRMEREQVMRLVLEWLFPEFGQSAGAYEVIGSSEADWQNVLEYGEYIKFVHDAIDWDRILVLLYPYFWDRPENHDEKLYLDHSDGTHKEFLRAGACRVLLAIKPGFEEDVISLLDKGQLGKLSPASRFKNTVDHVRAREKKFEAARAAATAPLEEGAELEDPPASTGDLIAEWADWTPTSALDMEVRLQNLI